MLTASRVASVVFAQLYLWNWAEGLTACRTRSIHCWPSNDLVDVFECPGRGHFQHPESSVLYYKCLGVDFAACTCTCKYEGMCFDPVRQQCAFSFLDSVHNCTGNAKQYHSSKDGKVFKNRQSSVDDLNENELVRERPKLDQSDPAADNRRTISGGVVGFTAEPSVVDGSDRHNDVPAIISSAHKTHAGRQSGRALRRSESHMFAARQSAVGFQSPGVIADKSRLPAWDIAIVVLVVIIMMVLIVILMY